MLRPYLYCCWSLVLFLALFVAFWWRFILDPFTAVYCCRAFSLQDFWHKTDKTIDSTLQNMPNENVQIRSHLFLFLRESVHWTPEVKDIFPRESPAICELNAQIVQFTCDCLSWCFAVTVLVTFKIYAPAVRDLIYDLACSGLTLINYRWGLFHAHNKILILTASLVGVHSLAQLKTWQLCNI